jgi:phosphoglycolate phosphatase
MVHSLRPLPTDSLRLLVFDLDGTLVDSCKDLCNSINGMLRHFERHPLPDAVIASYIGEGASMLVRRALGDPDDDAMLGPALTYFLDYYREHLLDNTYAYPGVLESLAALKNAPGGTPRAMAVLTNKPVRPAQAICDALGLSPYFFRVYGGNSFSTKKPDPLALNTLMREANVTPQQTLMIGDSNVDVLTARNADAWVLGCKFGLSPHTLEIDPPDCMVDTASDWVQALEFVRTAR